MLNFHLSSEEVVNSEGNAHQRDPWAETFPNTSKLPRKPRDALSSVVENPWPVDMDVSACTYAQRYHHQHTLKVKDCCL